MKDERTLRATASPEQLWRAFADPTIIAGWFADDARGEPTPGEMITHVFEHFGMELSFEVVEAIPGERLVLSGRGPGGRTFVQEVHVRPAEGGGSVLTLVHSGFDEGAGWEDEYEGMDSGWQLALAILGHYVEERFGQTKRSYMAMRPAELTWARLAPLYGARASRWLGGPVGAPGEAVSLRLADGLDVHGQVLVRSAREVALLWDELDGTLELKAFEAGPGRTMIALRALSWAASPPPREELEAQLGEALERLAEALGDVEAEDTSAPSPR